MRKFTLFLAMLVAMVTTSMAQTVPAANKLYTVVAEGHTNVSKPQWAINDEGTKIVSTGNTTVSTEEQKQFAFVTNNGATYIYSPAAKKFVLKDASLSAKTGDGVEELLKICEKYAIESPFLFPDDVTTDQPERQVMAEIIHFSIKGLESPYVRGQIAGNMDVKILERHARQVILRGLGMNI